MDRFDRPRGMEIEFGAAGAGFDGALKVADDALMEAQP